MLLNVFHKSSSFKENNVIRVVRCLQFFHNEHIICSDQQNVKQNRLHHIGCIYSRKTRLESNPSNFYLNTGDHGDLKTGNAKYQNHFTFEEKQLESKSNWNSWNPPVEY